MQLAIIIGGLIVALMIGIILYFNKFEVSEPNVGIVYFFGLITQRLVPGKKYYYIRKIGDFTIFKIVIMPGRKISIRISPDNAYSHNVKIDIDVEIVIWLKKARDGFPSFRACRRLLNLIHVNPGDTLFGETRNGTYYAGALDNFLGPVVSGAISRVLPEYEPRLITDNEQAVEALIGEISNAIAPYIDPWGGFDINIQDLHSSAEQNREDIRRNTAVEAEANKTIQEAHIDIIESYHRRLGKKGEKYATIYAATEALKGANVNLFGNGFTDAVGTFFAQKMQSKQQQRKRKKGQSIQPWNF
jgi:hypothetical protein